MIPLPSYGYGAVPRSRFAFGRITATQARTNTANQLSDDLEQENQQTEKEEKHTEAAEEFEAYSRLPILH